MNIDVVSLSMMSSKVFFNQVTKEVLNTYQDKANK